VTSGDAVCKSRNGIASGHENTVLCLQHCALPSHLLSHTKKFVQLSSILITLLSYYN